MGNSPKILFWDLETSLCKLLNFSLWDPTPMDNIVEDWFIICGAWKESESENVSAVSVMDGHGAKKPYSDDYHVVKTLRDNLENADILVAHNGDKFDWKKLQTRILFHGLPPLPKIKTIDTLKIAKREFKFTSNRLDYLAKFLGVDQKMSTSKGLWLRAMQGDRAALKEMVLYNKQDVIVLEKVFDKLRPYAKEMPHIGVYFDDNLARDNCPRCGSLHLEKRGFYTTKVGRYQRFQCTSCGSWGRFKDPVFTISSTRSI